MLAKLFGPSHHRRRRVAGWSDRRSRTSEGLRRDWNAIAAYDAKPEIKKEEGVAAASDTGRQAG